MKFGRLLNEKYLRRCCENEKINYDNVLSKIIYDMHRITINVISNRIVADLLYMVENITSKYCYMTFVVTIYKNRNYKIKMTYQNFYLYDMPKLPNDGIIKYY